MFIPNLTKLYGLAHHPILLNAKINRTGLYQHFTIGLTRWKAMDLPKARLP